MIVYEAVAYIPSPMKHSIRQEWYAESRKKDHRALIIFSSIILTTTPCLIIYDYLVIHFYRPWFTKTGCRVIVIDVNDIMKDIRFDPKTFLLMEMIL